MVEQQLGARGIVDDRVLAAMRDVPREAFVAPSEREGAYSDRALPLGHGQTVSQPFMVAAMCELARVGPDDRVLEIGGGSGYAAAVLDELAHEVVTIERIPELAAGARAALDQSGHPSVAVVVGDGSLGMPEQAPFDVIVVSAAIPALTDALVAQLADGGRLVAPVGGSRGQRLELVERHGDRITRSVGLACRFVPLVGEGGFPE